MTSLRSLNVLAFALVLGASSSATADGKTRKAEIHNKEHLFCLMQQDGFSASRTEGTVHAYEGPQAAEQSLRVLKYPQGNDFKRGKAFYKGIESGVVKSTRGYEFVSKKHYKVDGVPTLDMSFYRDGKNGRELVWKRFLFHKKFGLVASASAPADAKKPIYNRGRRFTRSLRPWFGRH